MATTSNNQWWQHLLAILTLPFNVIIVIPSILRWYLHEPWQLKLDLWLGGGLVCVLVGLSLMISTIRLFIIIGRGTLAPWQPTQQLVVAGPFRYLRNPMITGVLLILLGEALLFQSRVIAIWTVIFFMINYCYFVWKEEPDLIKRFGESYRIYRQHVPRWIPRLRPWVPDISGS